MFSDDVIVINGHTLSVIYDPPHLLKGLRNNFLNKDIKMDGKISKWSDIVEVYNTDCSHAQMRLLHKLNDEHVIPEKIKKMKVFYFTSTFIYNSLGCCLFYYLLIGKSYFVKLLRGYSIITSTSHIVLCSIFNIQKLKQANRTIFYN